MQNTKRARAIWYAQRERRIERVKRAGLWHDFERSKYKSLGCFLRAIGRLDLY